MTEHMLVAIGLSDPDVESQVRRQPTFEEMVRAAARWYERHPLPERFHSWSPFLMQAFETPPRSREGTLPPWGQPLPPIDDEPREAGADDQLEQVLALLARKPAKHRTGPKYKDPPPGTKRRVAELRIGGA